MLRLRHGGRSSPAGGPRLRAVVACVLVVVVAVGLLGGIAGLDLVAAPAHWVLAPDLATTWHEWPAPPPLTAGAPRAAADTPRPPPISPAR